MTFTLADITSDIIANQENLRTAVPEFDSLGRRKNRSKFGLASIERFTSKVLINKETGCWEWQGAFSKKTRYGQFRPYHGDRFKSSPHRFIYEYFHGEIPADLEIDHEVCDNRICCNPSHLVPKSHAENRKRSRKAFCKHGHAMTDENVYTYPKTGCRYCKKCKVIAVNRRMTIRLATDPEYAERRRIYQNRKSQERRDAKKRLFLS